MKATQFMSTIGLILCCCDTHHWGADAFSTSSHGRPAALSSPSMEDNAPSSLPRREALRLVVGALLSSSSINFVAPEVAHAVAPSIPPLQTASGDTVRVEGIGGGLDLQSPPRSSLTSSDVFYPSSMVDTEWRVQRAVTSVEGDLGQAALTWKLLGGSSDERAFTSRLTEVYGSRFIAAPDTMKDAYYEYDGKMLHAAILDRRFELSSRVGGMAEDAIRWDSKSGDNAITYARNNNDAVNLAIVQRKIEPPSDSGFGSDEVYRIESSAGGIFVGTNVYRAARVRRRYRRGFNEATGKRILDCIEIVTTHRVLDGIAGMEYPTSTCKNRLRYTQM